MKKLILSLLVLCLFTGLIAQQTPQGMQYQAVARDADGQILADQNISLKISLMAIQEKGNVFYYTEVHQIQTSKLGLFNLVVGEGSDSEGEMQKIPWSNEQIYMELALDETGGDDFEVINTSRLLTVPYAFHAGTADELTYFMGNERGNGNGNGNGPGVPANVWHLQGNSNSDPAVDKLGTTDCADLVIVTDNQERMRILCSGAILIDADLDIGNDLTVQNNVEVNISGGNTIIHGNLDVVDGSTTHLSGDLIVDGTTDLNSSLDVNNGSPTNLTGTLNVDGTTDLNSSLNVNNNSPTNLTGTLNVDGTTDLNNSLDVNNDSPTNLTGTLNVDGTTDLNNSLDVNNSSPTNLTGTLNVDGTTDLNNSLDVNNDSPTNLTGTLNVDGTTDLNSTLDVNNGSPTNLTGTLTVAGITNLNNNFNVNNSKPTNLTGTLNVVGISNFNNNVALNKCLQVGDASRVLLKFNPDKIITDEDAFSNYPLQISGSGAKQGIAIRMIDHAPTSNFIAFFAEGEMKGRIEGNTGFLVQNFNQTTQDLTTFDPNDANNGQVSGVDTVAQNGGNAASNAAVNNPLPTMGTTNSQINTEELVDFIILAVNFLDAVIQVATSFTSIFDPVDIFEAALGGVIATADLAVFVGFSIANVGVAYESGSGDYAEWLMKFDSEEEFQFGDVVGVIGGKISKSHIEAEKFMVVSAAPAVVGAMPSSDEQEDLYEKIAFLGQVPVKVKGAVEVGDYILPSGEGDGLAIALSREEMVAKDYLRIIGVAWEASKKEDHKKIYQMIKTAVGINQNDLAVIIDQMQTVMNQMQAAIVEVNPGYEGYVFDTDTEILPSARDYTVSSTHESMMAGYFEGKEYSSQEELGLLVKEALETQAGIDFSEYPVVERILLDPEYAIAAKAHYTNILDQYLDMMGELEGR